MNPPRNHNTGGKDGVSTLSKKNYNAGLMMTAAVTLITALPVFAQDDILERYRTQGGSGNVVQSDKMLSPEVAKNGAPSDLLSSNMDMSPDRIDGFNAAIEQAFPMTPEMIRQYRKILEETEKASRERPEPKENISTGMISLEPGEAAPLLTLAPSIASVVGFYDATGAAWPVEQFVLGNGEDFEAVTLGEASNNVVMTPQSRIGFTNLVVQLKDQAKPVTLRVNIAEDTADYRYDLQIMQMGPNAKVNNAATGLRTTVTEAGGSMLLSAISGVDIPPTAKPVKVIGVNARAWVLGDELYIRSTHAMLSPSWLESMAGPDGVRVYKISNASAALFNVDGQIVRADIKLP
jgi:intracellular multiplication protein IcmK